MVLSVTRGFHYRLQIRRRKKRCRFSWGILWRERALLSQSARLDVNALTWQAPSPLLLSVQILSLVTRKLAFKHSLWSITLSWMWCNSFGVSPGYFTWSNVWFALEFNQGCMQPHTRTLNKEGMRKVVTREGWYLRWWSPNRIARLDSRFYWSSRLVKTRASLCLRRRWLCSAWSARCRFWSAQNCILDGQLLSRIGIRRRRRPECLYPTQRLFLCCWS